MVVHAIDLKFPDAARPAVAVCHDVADLAVAPSGATVALVCRDSNLYLVDALHPSAATLPTPRAVALDPKLELQSVTFAPDGKSVYLTAMYGESGSYALLQSDLSGHARSLVQSNNRWMYRPSFSPDGTMLALSEMEIRTDVWLLEPR
jgi:Tol biopolymer transport system component